MANKTLVNTSKKNDGRDLTNNSYKVREQRERGRERKNRGPKVGELSQDRSEEVVVGRIIT